MKKKSMEKNIRTKNIDKVVWYNNPNLITDLIIFSILIIIILSQSFALKNGLSVLQIFDEIINRNSILFIILIYFLLLKTRFGKIYFDYLNLFLIGFYGILSITSFLTLIHAFSLNSFFGFVCSILIFIYLFHVMLRNTTLWKSLKLKKSPFNEFSNKDYFYFISICELILLCVNLIFTTSVYGTVISLFDTFYIVLFLRYIYLYCVYLDTNKIDAKNNGNFNKYRKKVKDTIDDINEEYKLDEKFDSIGDKINDLGDAIGDKIEDVSSSLKESIDDIISDDKEVNK